MMLIAISQIKLRFELLTFSPSTSSRTKMMDRITNVLKARLCLHSIWKDADAMAPKTPCSYTTLQDPDVG